MSFMAENPKRALLVSDEELHRAILVTQQMRFSRVMKTVDWIKQL